MCVGAGVQVQEKVQRADQLSQHRDVAAGLCSGKVHVAALVAGSESAVVPAGHPAGHSLLGIAQADHMAGVVADGTLLEELSDQLETMRACVPSPACPCAPRFSGSARDTSGWGWLSTCPAAQQAHRLIRGSTAPALPGPVI